MIRPCFRRHSRCRLPAASLLALLIAASAASAQTALTPHSAEYKVRISVLGGELSTELRATELGYVAQHVIRPTGMSRLLVNGHISEISEFRPAPDGLRPTRYSSEDTLSKEDANVDVSFDWDALRVTGTVNDEAIESLLDGFAHDRVSIQYELMHDLLNGGPSEQYTLFDVDRLKTVIVRNIGQKTVRVPAGEFEAVGIQHQSESSSRTVTLWCVPELDYLPVIIEQHRKGKLRVRAVLKHYSPAAT